MRGTFITFEGIEGSGKSTQARQLVARLREAGCEVLATREPGGTAIGEAIRTILLDPRQDGMPGETELLLLAAARADHVGQLVRPTLLAGTHVVCDRFSDSTWAYQGGGRHVAAELIEQADRMARGDLVPDFTVLLDLDAEIGLERARQRNAGRGASASATSRFDDEDLAFHRRVRSAYLRRAGGEPRRVWVVDAAGATADVAARVLALVKDRLPALFEAGQRNGRAT